MSDTWQDRFGDLWFGYWHTKLDGSWGYLMHPAGADTDMGDMEMHEVHAGWGPLKNGNLRDTEEVVIRRRFMESP